MKRFHVALAALGVAGLALLVVRIGPATLWADAARLGAGAAAAIVAIAFFEHALHVLGWRACFPTAPRPGLRTLLGAFLAGYGINLVTPTATLGGELARGTLVARGVRVAEAIASVTVDRLAFALADSAIGFVGLGLLLLRGDFTRATRLGFAAAALLLGAGIGTFFALQRSGRLASFLGRHPLLRRLGGELFAERVARGSSEVDAHLARFHAERRGALVRAVALHAAGTLVGAVQLAVFFVVLGVPATPLACLQVFCVSTALDLFTFFVPARLGAYEGSRILAMSVAGLDPDLGLLFSLVLRVEQVVWASVGLAAYAGLAARRGRAFQTDP